jgi:hypothetical protein
MDVFLIPTGRERYELYCEVPLTPISGDAAPTPFGRLKDTFRRALEEGEAEANRGGEAPDAPPRSKLRRAITRRLAEAVAEQRLLWQLRHQHAARLIYPDDMTAEAAMTNARQQFAGDRDRHRRWCAIDGGLTVASGVLAVVPGPNVLAYYFIFRTVGHYLSMKGAAQALGPITWTTVASDQLSTLRGALTLGSEERDQRIREIEEALGLERLARFVARVAESS